MAKRIEFTDHAEGKFEILERHGFALNRDQVKRAVLEPDRIETAYRGRRIAQKKIDDEHVLRVVFEDLPEAFLVVTFYPGRRSRYEDRL